MRRNKGILVRIAEDEKKQYEEFSKDNNRSVSEFMRDSARIVMRNPTLLDPSGETAQLIFDLDRFEKTEKQKDNAILDVFLAFSDEIDILKKQIQEVLKNQGVSKERISKIGKKDNLGSLISNDRS